MRTLRHRLVALSTVALLVLSGCSGPSSGAAATVHGTDIPRSQVEDAVTEITDRTGQLDDVDAAGRADIVAPLQRQVLSLLVQARIIERLAEDEGIEVDEDAIEEQMETATADGEEEFADALAEQQLTLEIYREVLLPSQQRVEGLREQLVGELPETEVRNARHILVEDGDEAEEIVGLLEDGADFGELAEERSTDEGSGAQGGELGPRPRGAYVEAFEEAVWNSELNEIVGPVESEFGFHVLEVIDEATVTGEDLDPEARRQAIDARLGEMLQEAFSDAEVEVDAAFGVWDPEVGAVSAAEPTGSGD